MRVGIGMIFGLGLLVGCKSSPAPEAGTPAAEHASTAVAPATPLDPATLGTVTGVVKLTGKPPTPIKIDTTMDPACTFGSSGDTYTEQYVVKDGKLANVYVYVKSGPAAAMKMGMSGSRAVLDQKGCSYQPHVVAIQMGGSVEFRNSDATMHNIHTMPTTVGNPPVDISQGPHGAPQVKQFRQPEVMMPVRCNNHPWMNAFINVAPTPFFAVTGADGSFELKGLPAGDYTLGAVQEKLGEQEIHVTVKPQAVAKAEFTYAMK